MRAPAAWANRSPVDTAVTRFDGGPAGGQPRHLSSASNPPPGADVLTAGPGRALRFDGGPNEGTLSARVVQLRPSDTLRRWTQMRAPAAWSSKYRRLHALRRWSQRGHARPPAFHPRHIAAAPQAPQIPAGLGRACVRTGVRELAACRRTGPRSIGRRGRRCWSALSASTAFVAASPAWAGAAGPGSGRALDRALDGIGTARGGPPGLSVLITRGSRPEFRRRGVGDVRTGRRAHSSGRPHRIASMAKAFNGAVRPRSSWPKGKLSL